MFGSRRRQAAILAVLAEHPDGLLTHHLARKLGFPRRFSTDLHRLQARGVARAREVRNWNPAVASQWRWQPVAPPATSDPERQVAP